MTKQAVIFDMDGVITDSEPLYGEAVNVVLAKEGLTLSDEDHRAIMGSSIRFTWRYVIDRLGLDGDVEDWTPAYDRSASRGEGTGGASDAGGRQGGHGAEYSRLGAWYFAYFAAAGVFLPYFSTYLFDRGLDARAVGVLFAALTVTKLVTPWLWGWAADRSGSRKRVVCVASAGALLAFAAVAASPGFWSLFAALVVFGFFWQGALPQFEALALTRLGERATRYVHVRLWGSVGYVAAVTGVGALLERLAVSSVPLFVLGGLLLILVASVVIPADPGSTSAPAAGGPDSGGRPPIPGWLVAFFLASLAMQASHGAFYTFFTPFLLDHGYRPAGSGRSGPLASPARSCSSPSSPTAGSSASQWSGSSSAASRRRSCAGW